MASWIFGKEPTTKEQVKEVKRSARKGQREISRELAQLERQEKTLIADIRKRAQKGNDRATRALAKQLVQLRAAKDRLTTAKTQLASTALQATTMGAQAAVAESLGSTAKVLGTMNKRAAGDREMLREFMVEQERAGIREELVDDMLADAFDEPGTEEATDELVGQVLQEVGMAATDGIAVAPTAPAAQAKGEGEAQAKEGEAGDDVSDEQINKMLAELNAL